MIDKQVASNHDDKWYIRPHHIESLTEHPNSLKDNVIDSNYYTFYSELERDWDTGEYIDPAITAEARKPTETDNVIEGLEAQIANLKRELGHMSSGKVSRHPTGPSIPINPIALSKAYQLEEQLPKNTDAMTVAYESVLDDLRK
jgi:hypothetical protein